MMENDYDRILEQIPFLEPMDAVTLSHIDEGSRVLEIGTGTGLLTEKLAKKGCTVVSVDPYLEAPSHRMISQKRMSEFPNVRLLAHDIFDIEESDFEYVISRFTYHHIIEKLRLVQKCYDALRKGGKIIVADAFIPEHEDRQKAVKFFHNYRERIAQLGIAPIEEGIREQDLVQDGEYKTTKSILESQMREVGFEVIGHHVVTAEYPIDYELLGYAVFEGTKLR